MTDDAGSGVTLRWRGVPRAVLAEAGAWLVPLIIAIELVGTTFGNTVRATLGLLALFVVALWLAPVDSPTLTVPRWLIWAGRGLGAVCLCLGLGGAVVGMMRFLGPLHLPPPDRFPQWMTRAEGPLMVPILSAWLVAAAVPLLRGRRAPRDAERAGLFVAVVFVGLLLARHRVQGLFVMPYGKAGLETGLWIVGAALLLVALVPKLPAWTRILLVLGVGLSLRGVGLSTWALDPALRDMLPLVKSAQDTFALGENPYTLHQMQRGSVVPLTYLPGMWLLWGVPRLVGADLRWFGLLADAAICLGLFFAASRVAPTLRARAQGLAIGFAAAWLTSPSMHWNGIYAEPHAWLFVLALLLWATLSKRWWIAAAALGVAVCTRHFGLVVAPFVLVAMVRDVGWRAAVPRVALSGALAAVLLAPFVFRDPDTFWFGTFRWLVEYGPVHQSWFWEKYGFSGPLYKAQATEWMVPAQIAAVLTMLLPAALLRGARAFIAPAGTAYVLFIMFNGIIWDSFYLEAALFPAFAAAGGYAAARTASPVRVPSRRVLVPAGAVLAASALVGGLILGSLAATRSTKGSEATREFVLRSVTTGDAVIDHSDWTLAFVQGDPLFAAGAPPARVGREPFDGSLGGLGIFEHQRAWLVSRGRRDRELIDTLERTGSVFEDRTLGRRYRVLGVRDTRYSARLGALAFAPSFAPNPDDPLLPLAPSSGGRFTSPAVTFVEVQPRVCRIGGHFHPMVYAHPAAGGTLALDWRAVTLGRALVVIGGIEDAGVVWGRARVRVTPTVAGGERAPLTIRNLPGVQLTVIDTRDLAGQTHPVRLALSTENDAQRFTCVDGLVLP